MRTVNHLRALRLLFCVVCAVLFLGGCSSSSDDMTLRFSPGPGGGTHPVDWLSIHPGFAVSDVGACTTCHGDDLAGGISNTSCFTAACHHGTAPGWETPAVHGASAKASVSSGFKACQICHAASFTGGGSQVSCLNNVACHGAEVQSPHPASWRTGDTYVHTTVAEGNASVCAFCHTGGANSPIAPPDPPAPGGTPPGCFNSTLCHGAGGAPHPVGGTWVTAPPAAQPHGNDAKAVPGATTGFNYCQICHGTGTDFAGGSSGHSCYPCHGASAPHPASWRTGDTYVHTTVAEGNASVCAFCHTGGANSPIAPPDPPAPGGTPPGCFNSTLCHGAGGAPHPVGGTWVTAPPAAQPHGNNAKAVPGATTGFNYCQICHGNDFTGGTGTTCLNNSACHGTGVQSPHASQWRPGDTYVHTTTDEGNAPVCALCHYNEPGAGAHTPTPPPAGVTVGCFNSTLCHGAGGVPAGTHATGWLDFDNSAAFHGSFVGQITCETAACHPISGHPTCTTCHFDNQGSRANASLDPSFAHDGNVFKNHREESLASAAGTVCENCHQTSRTFRAGAPPSSCGPSRNHPNNEGCHYNGALLDPVLTNPRF
ncbi:MAG: hypothetical protein OEM47_02250 [Deltaproteobacteria bacterium]|nr:hypothetical protein [Deltaproteobacteria bacterium]